MKTQMILALTANLVLFVCGAAGCCMEWKRSKQKAFKFYTFDSNVFGVIGSLVYSVCLIISLATGAGSVPEGVAVLKYMSACCLSLTFVVVLAVLAPQEEGGYKHALFAGPLMFQHTICPILAILTVIFFDLPLPGVSNIALVALVPTILYAIVTIILNLFRKLSGPYPFLKVYNQPVYMSVIWVLVIVGGAFGLAVLLKWLSGLI